MLIRQIKYPELPQLRHFAEYTFRQAWQKQNDNADFEAYCTKNFTIESLQKEMDQPETLFFFVEEADQLIAYIKINKRIAPDSWLDASERAIQLERIYVDPSVQNKGIGDSLLKFVVHLAKTEAYQWIWLTVWQEAPKAIAFYEKNGFEICGSSDFWLGQEQQTDWLMKKLIL